MVESRNDSPKPTAEQTGQAQAADTAAVDTVAVAVDTAAFDLLAADSKDCREGRLASASAAVEVRKAWEAVVAVV